MKVVLVFLLVGFLCSCAGGVVLPDVKGRYPKHIVYTAKELGIKGAVKEVELARNSFSTEVPGVESMLVQGAGGSYKTKANFKFTKNGYLNFLEGERDTVLGMSPRILLEYSNYKANYPVDDGRWSKISYSSNKGDNNWNEVIPHKFNKFGDLILVKQSNRNTVNNFMHQSSELFIGYLYSDNSYIEFNKNKGQRTAYIYGENDDLESIYNKAGWGRVNVSAVIKSPVDFGFKKDISIVLKGGVVIAGGQKDYTYNKFGDMIRMSNRYGGSDAVIDQYEKDSCGNWISRRTKITEYNVSTVNIEKRTISYYSECLNG